MVEDGLEKIVGVENVIRDVEQLKDYVPDTNNFPHTLPIAAVRPENIAELQEIVTWANNGKVPLVPVS